MVAICKWLLTVVLLYPFIAVSTESIQGDPVQGEMEYQRCQGCHSLRHHRTGPRHCGLMNRKVGTEPSFDYSAAMRDANLVWDSPTLDRFLAAPVKTIPGTRMVFYGIRDAQVRRDLIAYLDYVSTNNELCP